MFIQKQMKGFAGGAVDKNLSANVGNTDSIPDSGFHLPWGN